MAGKINSPINPALIRKVLTYPISARQIAGRVGCHAGTVTYIIAKHFANDVDSDLRYGNGSRSKERHYWLREN